ncbi:MAG: serine/threonine transporter SstT [Bacteroidaceae bacterium]|jgi:serine/threonine transporter|nr:serine/threonine transporter SstT [Bacteroidaceae bacterium]MBQ2300348.1 serine/threonine transporter SstT [Bacteroidaceae bacterium]MBQ5714212.1 serine/threonine transporter SstT [Bacteroidaceae bacterium]
MNIIKAYTRTSLILRILAGVVIGALLAVSLPGYNGMCILGDLFVGALKGIAPVLVAVLVASAIAKSGSGLSSRFNTVITLYLFTTLLAAIFAVLASHFFPVGISVDNVASVEGAAPGALDEVFRKILKDITSNPLAAIANANYLSILFWAVVIGLALKIVASERTIASLGEWADAVSKVVGWIIQCAPFGIMGLVYTSVSASGLEIFTTYGQLLLLLVGCMLTVSLVVNPIIVGLLLRRNPYPLVWRCLKESGVSAFFTRSSAANIPVNMELCKRMGLDKDFYSVSIPLGSIINMNGAAVTITVMTLATCHALGIDITLGSSLLLSIIAALGACGTSGVAGGSLLLIPMACSLFGISNDIAMQTVAVGFIIGVVQDSVETALNSSGDVLFTITAEMRERMKRGK